MKIKELGHVVLYVSNLERSAKFYGDVLGFGEVVRMGNQAVVYSGGRTHHELMLLEVGGEPESKISVRPGL
jgi:catechol 2,3-dioxygenase-like lactoylglutathione lyase family enzyme